jgi:Flp pilus assembly protein TadG
MRTPRKHFTFACQRGNALIELGLVISILMVLMAGIFEYGRAFWFYETLTKATRDAARTFSVTPKTNIASSGVDKAKAIVYDAAIASGISDFTTSNVTVTCLDWNGTDYADGTCTNGTAPAGVRVQVSYDLTIGQFIPFVSNGSGGTTLAPRTSMRFMDAK